jgi:uncharacterized protein YpuA (DUF1002 family)
MTQATDTDIREIKDLIAAGTVATQKQIADLSVSTQKQIADSAIGTQKQITDLCEEMRIGFTKLEGKIDKVDAKYEERTKLGFWGFIALRINVRTLFESIIDAITKFFKFTPTLLHPIFEYRPQFYRSPETEI